MVAQRKRKLPVRKQTITLDGEYDGWTFEARINVPLRVLRQLSKGNFDDLLEGLTDVIIGWNFVDESGKPLGKPALETIESLPYDLVTKMVEKISSAVTTLAPN